MTRKITLGVAAIVLGARDSLHLGNLDAVRDWGYAPEYVEGMWRMLQHDEPDDYVLATGQGRTVREFAQAAFAHAGLDWQQYVTYDEQYERPVRGGRPHRRREQGPRGPGLEGRDPRRPAGAADGRRGHRADDPAAAGMSARPGFDPPAVLARLYPEASVGGYTKLDGLVEFYTRVGTLVDARQPGARLRRRTRRLGDRARPRAPPPAARLRGRVARVVGTDVDPVVTSNPALDEAHVVGLGDPLPFDDGDVRPGGRRPRARARRPPRTPRSVAADLMRVLKPGGWLAARTPNKWGLIGVAARAVPNRLHVAVLERLQPDRQAEDVFPVRYAMNTRKDLQRAVRAARACTSTATPASRATSAARPRRGGWRPGWTASRPAGSPRR